MSVWLDVFLLSGDLPVWNVGVVRGRVALGIVVRKRLWRRFSLRGVLFVGLRCPGG